MASRITKRRKKNKTGEGIWIVTSKTRPAYGHKEILGAFVRKKDCHKFLRLWLPRRAWKYPLEDIDVYRFPQGFVPEWRTIEAPYDIVTHEFLFFDPDAKDRHGRRGVWKVRKKPLTTLGMVRDEGPSDESRMA